MYAMLFYFFPYIKVIYYINYTEFKTHIELKSATPSSELDATSVQHNKEGEHYLHAVPHITITISHYPKLIYTI